MPREDASMDASLLSDASSHDGDAGRPSCSTGSLSISTVSDTFLSPLEPLAVSLHNEGASLGWVAFQGGRSRALTRWFGVTGDMLEVLSPSDDNNQTQPAIVATRTGFLSVSSDDVAGSFQLRVRRTGVTGELIDGEPKSLTSDTANNRAPVLASGADGNVVVAWTAASPSAHGKLLTLDPDGKPLGAARDIPDFGANVGRSALSAVGSGYLLAWVDATARRVHVLRLDAGGVPQGQSTQIDAEGNARGNLDLAFTDQGGALVFDVLVDGVRPEVRLRNFDVSGFAIGSERRLTPYPDTGARPSLIAIRGGFVLAYRSVQGSARQLRLMLLDGRGASITSADVAAINGVDLPLALRVSPDGEAAFLGWLDQLPDSNGYQLQRTWIHCD